MAAQKEKRKIVGTIFYIFEWLLTQNPSNQDSQLSWFFQTISKTAEKSKQGNLREAFLSEIDFQTSSTVKQMHEIQTSIFSNILLHMNSIKFKNFFGHLITTSSKCHKFWG